MYEYDVGYTERREAILQYQRVDRHLFDFYMLMQSVCNTLVIVEMYMVSKKPFDPIGKRKWVNYSIIISFLLLNAFFFVYFYDERFDEYYQ